MESSMSYNLDVTPNYSYIFEFENEFIHQNSRKWMKENWTVAFYYVGIYMAFIFGGQYYMQNRPRESSEERKVKEEVFQYNKNNVDSRFWFNQDIGKITLKKGCNETVSN
ncbi:unnamed protein product [Euphydryas editha]|uniref:Transmembrane protein n=1 Tax=Euphydryas editha TaxID=104508 RepID=A0AAU9V4N3_EUPED|nr:unnamed protein product [Euphydryas editha]